MEIKELKTIHDLVKDILEEHPQARDSDNILYYYVCKYIGTKHGFDIDKMSLPNFLLNMKNYRLPSIRSLEDVAEYKHKSYRWVTAVHGRALSNVQRILNKRQNDDKNRVDCLVLPNIS